MARNLAELAAGRRRFNAVRGVVDQVDKYALDVFEKVSADAPDERVELLVVKDRFVEAVRIAYTAGAAAAWSQAAAAITGRERGR